ncbi:MAG: hypothetical protein ACLUKN_14840 [Bacilli bacterium]
MEMVDILHQNGIGVIMDWCLRISLGMILLLQASTVHASMSIKTRVSAQSRLGYALL